MNAAPLFHKLNKKKNKKNTPKCFLPRYSVCLDQIADHSGVFQYWSDNWQQMLWTMRPNKTVHVKLKETSAFYKHLEMTFISSGCHINCSAHKWVSFVRLFRSIYAIISNYAHILYHVFTSDQEVPQNAYH